MPASFVCLQWTKQSTWTAIDNDFLSIGPKSVPRYHSELPLGLTNV